MAHVIVEPSSEISAMCVRTFFFSLKTSVIWKTNSAVRGPSHVPTASSHCPKKSPSFSPDASPFLLENFFEQPRDLENALEEEPPAPEHGDAEAEEEVHPDSAV